MANNESDGNKEDGARVKASAPKEGPSPVVLTVGRSTHTLEEFIGLLKAHGAIRVVDVRTVPRSRHNPQFNKDSLPEELMKAGLGYVSGSTITYPAETSRSTSKEPSATRSGPRPAKLIYAKT
jgi:hypothetical protein